MTRLKEEILYINIYKSFVDKIKKGELKANEKLSSKRTLAKRKNVSIITIEKAYDQLLSEGYIYSIEKKGYYVSDIEFTGNREKKETTLKKDNDVQKYLFDFTSTSSGKDVFPFSSWAKIARKVISNNKEELLLPCSFKGHDSLRRAIANHLNNYLGINVSDDQIIISSGSESLYSLLINFFGRNEIYALEDPGHTSISYIYDENQLNYNFVPLDEKGIRIDKLNEIASNIVHVSTNHHYPSGINMPISRRYELLNYAIKNNSIIIEDDYDSELRLKGKPIPPLYSLDESGHVIYLNTFSMTLAPSFRIAYMVLPKKILKQYENKMSNMKCSVPVLDQLILADFIFDGSFERLLNRKKKKYRDIREKLLNELNKRTDLKISEADMGLHLLIEYPYDISDLKAEEIAQELKMKIYTLSHFMHNKKDTHTLLVKYTSIDQNNLDLAIKLLNELFDGLKSI